MSSKLLINVLRKLIPKKVVNADVVFCSVCFTRLCELYRHDCGKIYCEDCFTEREDSYANKCECGIELGFFESGLMSE